VRFPSQQAFSEQPLPSAYLRPNDRLDFDAPMLEATLGGRHVILGSAKYRTTAGGESVMVPMTESRYQRALDIEHNRVVDQPWHPSMLSGFDPLRADNWLSIGGIAFAATIAAAAVAGWLLMPKR